ncbi:MAG TPA: DUF1003 domain-containing protein [Aliidongia sp.]|uniref:DUF1003 domain-containing protein n=1 Tax=Aliidongia sp. TaxID=1914230 RepID=UPI002DDD1D86|nr:DUF1003 domain-containing protein [Aliidongia sp.]HEV2673159.1 DUF1003 domain-containing protein [Aliidongia sp.]
MLDQLIHPLQVEEMRMLLRLREARRRHRAAAPSDGLTLGQRVSDGVAATVGSWKFIIIQSVILVIWMFLNVTAYVEQWDPYPFILLNLVLSFQAAYTAPVIMMSQNRQGTIDRESAQHDYDINIKSELEIELLHQKLDMLREKEFAEMVTVIRGLESQLAITHAALIALSNR